MPEKATKGERLEGAVQVLILLSIGGVAAAASFTHVHDLATLHGQPSWIGWADAVTLELMSIGSGLEIRRRKRQDRDKGVILTMLLAAVALSLSAQVAAAERSVWGWLMAALPALGFLACVKIVLSRTAAVAAEPVVVPPPVIVPPQPEPPVEPEPALAEPAEEPVTVLEEPEVDDPGERPASRPRRRTTAGRSRRPLEESVQILRNVRAENPEAGPEDFMAALGISTHRQLRNIQRAASFAA